MGIHLLSETAGISRTILATALAEALLLAGRIEFFELRQPDDADATLVRALQAAGETLSNTAMRNNVDDAIVRVREGSSLSRALGNTKTFPPVLVHLIRSGEATGDVTTMLDRASEGEARELERRTMFLTSLLEPLLILAMGGVVLVIVLAVMLPIIELNNLVQ